MCIAGTMVQRMKGVEQCRVEGRQIRSLRLSRFSVF